MLLEHNLKGRYTKPEYGAMRASRKHFVKNSKMLGKYKWSGENTIER